MRLYLHGYGITRKPFRLPALQSSPPYWQLRIFRVFYLTTTSTKYYLRIFLSKDFLSFTDLKSYQKRLEETWTKTDLTDSIRIAKGKVKNQPLVVGCMDFDFIGGSLGSVMGERIARAVDTCLEENTPLLIICKSGGARMMESAFSLMQLAKVSGKLSQLTDAKIPLYFF